MIIVYHEGQWGCAWWRPVGMRLVAAEYGKAASLANPWHEQLWAGNTDNPFKG